MVPPQTTAVDDGFVAAFAARCQAAEELWALGHAAESYLLWRSALEALAAALDRLSEPPADLAHGVRAALAVVFDTSVRARPEIDAPPNWLELARKTSARAVAQFARRKAVQRRIVAPALATMLALVSLLVLVFKAGQPVASASGQYAAEYAASKAVDGSLDTEWLLPDGALGHLDVALLRRRAVHSVELINGHNKTYMDRAIRRARVLVIDDDRVVDSVELQFAGIAANALARSVRLKGEKGTRVRLEVLEHFERGAALAELRVD